MSTPTTGLSRFERRVATAGASKTIDQFCEAQQISRSHYYNLKRNGKGPREAAVGNVKRITPEAHADWRRDRERDALNEAASLPVV
jgi:hypothetical protein